MPESNISSNLQKALAELESTRDRIRVQLHLLSMEAKDRWKDIEQRLEVLEQQAGEEASKASEATLNKAQDLSNKLRAFLEEHLPKGN